MVSLEDTCPVGIARALVRAMMASILCSIKQLNAAAAPDAKAIPSVVAMSNGKGTIPGVARNIPIMAVNTISEVTLGLHREKKLLMLAPMFCIEFCLVIFALVFIRCSRLLFNFNLVTILVTGEYGFMGDPNY
jgi:hypothetical protein